MITYKMSTDTSFVPVSKTHNGPLPPGTYYSYISVITGERIFVKIKDNSDTIYHLPGLPIEFILGQMKNFWEKSEQYKKYGFLQKRGIMLYGPPGCGKSSIVNLLRQQVTDIGGIVFIPSGGTFESFSGTIAAFREIEPDRPIMTLVEDIETLLEGSNGSSVAQNEKAALSLYDGENQANNIIHVATTNKPDVLADRFIRRPGRFDVIVGVHNPSEETRAAYLKQICNGHLTPSQLAEILKQTEGLSLAYLREIASTYLVLGTPLEETVARLRLQAKVKYSTNRTGFTIGFKSEED